MPIQIQHLTQAIRILRKLPIKKAYEGEEDLHYADETAVRILEMKKEIERLAEEQRLLRAEITRVSPFGDFSLDDIDYIEKEGKREIQFFCIKSFKSHAVKERDDLIFVGTDYGLDYFISIDKEAKPHPDMIEMRIDRPLGELQTHLHFVSESLHQMEAELKGFAGHLQFLRDALVAHLNDYHLALAKKEVTYPFEDSSLFAVEAWIPENKLSIFSEIIQQLAIHSEPIRIEEKDRTPTYMENKGIARMGEDLVHIYDVPATTDKDPSIWVFWAFALFFLDDCKRRWIWIFAALSLPLSQA